MVENPLVRPEFGSLPPNRFPYSVLLPLVSRLIFDLSAPRFVLRPHLNLSFSFFGCPPLGSSYTSPRPILNFTCQSRTLDLFIVHHNPMLIGLTFHTKLDVYPLLQILVTHFSANSIPWTQLVCSSCKTQVVICPDVLGYMKLTQHLSDTLRPFRELNCRTIYLCVYIMRHSSETASRPNKRLMRTYHWISLFMSYIKSAN
jgi:hypothetical protein